MESVKKKKTATEAFVYLSGLCARGEYCISDMRRKMRSWEMPEGADNEVIARLLKERFVDENRYACAFVRDKFRHNRWGWMKIETALRRKGIKAPDIESAKDELNADDAIDTLRKLLETKRRNITGKNDYDIQSKLMRFALSRGFSYEQIEEAMR